MKRSYCLLQVLDYRESVKKTSGVCYKSLKSWEEGGSKKPYTDVLKPVQGFLINSETSERSHQQNN